MLENLLNSYSDDSSSTTSSSSQEEDFINMEVDDHHHHSFNSSIFNHSSATDFEFQQSFSSSSDRDPHATTTSPADELFYMGKLLPLHLPPRLEMVHKILHSTPAHAPKGVAGARGCCFDDEPFSTPLFTPTSATTPFESCNISPSESCEVSRELTPDDYKHIFVEYNASTGIAGAAVLDENRKSWTRKMKAINKQSSASASSKIKWTSYFKSLFTKSSGCTSQHSAAAAVSKAKQSISDQSKYAKNSAPPPFGQIKYNKNDILVEDQRGRHRRSFSGAIKHLSKMPKSSTAASSTPTTTSNLNLLALKRSINSSSEVESPIQAAIAHCKRSQKARQIAEEERLAVCRG